MVRWKKVKRYTLVVVVVAVVGGVVLALLSGPGTPSYESATIARGTVENIVNVTGKVEPTVKVSLSFPAGGKVERLLVDENDTANIGSTVAVLESGVLEAQYLEAQARALREVRYLEELQAGTRTESLRVAELAKEQAATALMTALASLETTHARAYVLADTAIREDADALFENPQGDSPAFGIIFKQGTTRYYIQADNDDKVMLSEKRRAITDLLDDWFARLTTPEDDTPLFADEALEDLAYIQLFLSEMSVVVNDYVPLDSNEQTIYEALQTAVASARTSVNTALSELRTALDAYENAAAALVLADSQFSETSSGARHETLRVQEAVVAAATHAAEALAHALDDTYLVAPLSGTVTGVYVEAGEVVAVGQTIADVQSETFELVAYIPEADIAHVAIGDEADITFDAYEATDIFTATLVKIADGETVREGVPTYKTTFTITVPEGGDYTLKSGMTADIDVRAAVREDVLSVPTRAILARGGDRFVRQYQDGEFVEVLVTVGLKGSSGFTEVTSGLAAGDEVVLYVNE